jgi:hypothetical protein
MTLVKKEAKTLWGVAAALAVLVVLREMIQLYYYLRYPEAFGMAALSPPLFRGYIIAFNGFLFTQLFLLPVILVLYLFIRERLSRTHMQIHALPVPHAWWITAKIAVPAVILGGLSLLRILLGLVVSLIHANVSYGIAPTFSQFLQRALNSSPHGPFMGTHVFLQASVLLMTVTFLAYTAALVVGRHKTVVWIVVMVAIMVPVSIIDTQLRPMFSGYVEMTPLWEYHTYGWFLIGYPLMWIALTLGAGLFLHEKYGEA